MLKRETLKGRDRIAFAYFRRVLLLFDRLSKSQGLGIADYSRKILQQTGDFHRNPHISAEIWFLFFGALLGRVLARYSLLAPLL